MDFADSFKKVMDEVGLRPSILAKATGRSRSNISDIRNGKVRPNIEDFAGLLEIAEQLRPGFIEIWACELLGVRGFLPYELSSQQMAILLKMVANALKRTQLPNETDSTHEIKHLLTVV